MTLRSLIQRNPKPQASKPINQIPRIEVSKYLFFACEKALGVGGRLGGSRACSLFHLCILTQNWWREGDKNKLFDFNFYEERKQGSSFFWKYEILLSSLVLLVIPYPYLVPQKYLFFQRRNVGLLQSKLTPFSSPLCCELSRKKYYALSIFRDERGSEKMFLTCLCWTYHLTISNISTLTVK